jgi:ATP-dependent exoDNAse (exonuclease V) alpha subunit
MQVENDAEKEVYNGDLGVTAATKPHVSLSKRHSKVT